MNRTEAVTYTEKFLAEPSAQLPTKLSSSSMPPAPPTPTNLSDISCQSMSFSPQGTPIVQNTHTPTFFRVIDRDAYISPAGANGCSGGMDYIARWWSRIFFAAQGKGRTLAFTFCCDEHDLFYDQGGSWRDRAFADKILRKCIAENLRDRTRPWFVRMHVPWIFWLGVRLGGWWFWAK